jgi:DNA (cytosine-5)-methyltransferase 1
MTHLDLFSGIGGFSLGLKRVFNIEHTYFSEIDKYAIDVYKNNFKNITYVKSVTDVRGGELPGIDIITFGSPCQDFSMAGKRKGMDGARSSLITEAIRLIKECRPSFFIWENVKGTFSSNNGADFWAIINAFTNIGDYRLEWQLLNTKWFLPQNRERIYLVGCLGKGSGRQIFPITESIKRDFIEKESSACITTSYHKGVNFDNQLIQEIRVKTNNKKGYEIAVEGDTIYYQNLKSTTRRGRVGKQIAQTLDSGGEQAVVGYTRDAKGKVTNYHTKHIANTLHSSSGGGGNTDQYIIKPTQIGNSENFGNAVGKENQDAFTLRSANPNGVIINQSIRRLTPIECERLQGFPDNWTRYGQELGEISDSQRYKMCGNAVTVDVVEAVAKKIKESL